MIKFFMGQLPNLFIVGAAKSGTTSLYYYLSQHPEVFMSRVKEPHFFADVKSHNKSDYQSPSENNNYHTKIVKELKAYLALFEDGKNFKYRGEASPSYLYDEHASQKIYDFNSKAKIIVILREPVQRAISHYNMVYNLGREISGDFTKAIENDIANNDKIWGGAHLYLELGLYYKQLKRYYDLFDSEQIHLLKFEDFIFNPLEALKKIAVFLAIDESPIDDFKMESKNSTNYLATQGVQRILYLIKNNYFLNNLKNKVPGSVKNLLKSYAYSKDDTQKKIIGGSTKEKIENFFLEDKAKLKMEFKIEW